MEMCVDVMVNISFVLAKQKQPEMALRPLKGLGRLTAIHLSLIWMAERLGWTDCHTFVFFLVFSPPDVCHSACVWPAALKLGCVTNSDMLFLVMGSWVH